MSGEAGLIDSHVHLQDSRLLACGNLASPRIAIQLVNGTCPDDWEAVARIEDQHGTKRFKAFGVHPWKVGALTGGWQDALREYLTQSVAISVGEIGLDNWIEPRNEALQQRVFCVQLELAKELKLPPTLHCLRAWEPLVRLVKEARLDTGFLVHGFGGSLEVQRQLLELGGYFSFSSYAADPRRKRMREALAACPADRLLFETDAPDMAPPVGKARFPLQDASGNPVHHPHEILSSYLLAAELRECASEDLVTGAAANFARLFVQSGNQP